MFGIDLIQNSTFCMSIDFGELIVGYFCDLEIQSLSVASREIIS